MQDPLIFIFEENIIIAMDLKSILISNGYMNVFIYSNKNAIINDALNNPPNLIISEVILNQKDEGIVIAEKIWQQHKIPFIFVTSIPFNYYKNKLDKSICEFIPKPFNEEKLLHIVDELVLKGSSILV